MEEETNGITFKEIFKTIASQKWLALILTVLITVAGILTFQYGLNPGSIRYVSSFGLVLPNQSSEDVNYFYPDGKPFQYMDLISAETLEEVKNSNEIFNDVNVNAIIIGGMSVSRNVSETKEVTYTISANANCFASYEIARAFITALASSPVNYLKNMHVNYDVYISLSKDADNYDSELALLKSQLDYVSAEYSRLIQTYGGNFVVNSRTLSSYYNEITAYSERNSLGILLAQVRAGAILKNEDSIENYRAQKVDLTRQLTIAENTLKILTDGSSGNGAQGNVIYTDAAVIKAQSDLVESLRLQISDINRYLGEGDYEGSGGEVDEQFEQNYIKPEYDIISGYTDTLNAVMQEVYEKASSVSFSNATAVIAEGGTGLVNSAIISLVLGVVIALIVAYIVGYILRSKSAKKSEPNQPVEEKEEHDPEQNR